MYKKLSLARTSSTHAEVGSRRFNYTASVEEIFASCSIRAAPPGPPGQESRCRSKYVRTAVLKIQKLRGDGYLSNGITFSWPHAHALLTIKQHSFHFPLIYFLSSQTQKLTRMCVLWDENENGYQTVGCGIGCLPDSFVCVWVDNNVDGFTPDLRQDAAFSNSVRHATSSTFGSTSTQAETLDTHERQFRSSSGR